MSIMRQCPISIKQLEYDGKVYWSAESVLAVLAWSAAEGGTLVDVREGLETALTKAD